ncbi:hypothetical protein D7D52_23520 [Nocardia yunnanensis]|uniref:tRNA-binding domain-containing protein n=1 Tax=Nocardia yunnanensis TaxID=2382165 RepID=A0A386ZGR2_9NOCA|nr:hypothetical protein [Nocardia yunnanensis]AYF76304.1 hypothetical protein D7D52_23520 [Nocardia yunnanensis]
MSDPTCDGQTRGVVVARVLEDRPHPMAQRIRLATIDLGGSKQQVVYGGRLVLTPGQFVPAALPGARLPGRKKMRCRRYHGESSYGMVCSSDELGWTTGGPDEVAILDPELMLEPGQSLDEADERWLLRVAEVVAR